jgi:hypothetical protein
MDGLSLDLHLAPELVPDLDLHLTHDLSPERGQGASFPPVNRRLMTH